MKVMVVDLDDTLFIHSWWTCFFFKISRFFHQLALRCVKLNKDLAEDISHHKVIILSGRSFDWEGKFFAQQLKRHGVKYHEMILCPRINLVMVWKKAKLKQIKKKYGDYTWFDDMKDVLL